MAPMFSPEAAYAFTAIAQLAFAATLIILWRAQREERALAVWALATLFSAMRYATGVLAGGTAAWAGYAIDAFTVASMALLVHGAALFLGRRPPLIVLAVASAIAFVWLGMIRATGLPAVWHANSVALVTALAMCLVALAFHAAWRKERVVHYATLAVLLGAWAATWLLVPVVRSVEPLAILLLVGRVALLLGVMFAMILMVQDRLMARLQAEVRDRKAGIEVLRGAMDQLREARESALANQRRVEDLVETSSDWFWETGRDMRFTFVSSGVEAITGIPAATYLGKTRDEVQAGGAPWGDVTDLKRLVGEHQPFRSVRLSAINRATGKPVTYAVSGKPVFDADGAFAGYRGTGRDLTQQVETQAMLDVVLGGIAHTVGPDYLHGLVGHLAQAVHADIAAVAAVDLSKRRLRSLVHWKDGVLTENLEHALDGTPAAAVVETGFQAHERGAAAIFADDTLLRDERIEAYIGIALGDASGRPMGVLALMWRSPPENAAIATTILRALAPRAAAELERQIADERLRDSERRFRAVLDNMPLAVVLRLGERYVIANKTFAGWVGLTVPEVERMTDREVYAHAGWSEDARRTGQAINERVRVTRQAETRERSLKLADGRHHDVVVSTFPVTGAGGEVAAVGVVLTDITQLRRAEISLAQAQKMDALGRLAGGIAHDFNNIVGAIAGFARFIAEDAPGGSKTRQYAERILTASSRAKQLIQQILTFSRRTEVARQRVPVDGMLDEVVGLLRATMPSSTRLELEASWPGLAIDADPAQIAQVLVNVCVNANDALGGKPGRIGLNVTHQAGDAAAAEIAQSAEVVERGAGTLRYVTGAIDRARQHVCIAVRDNGTGMARDVLERLYEPFFTTKPKGQGTGLGLPVVHGIVLAHGGAIAVTSRPGDGTTFQVWLPAASDASAPASAETMAPSPSGRGYVLVVDDDDHFGDMIATSLERLGYEAAILDHPAQALAAFDADPALWDIVITDQTMPELSGLDVIAHVKAARPDLPCVLCTGFGQPVTEASARKAGADAYLAKPLDPSVLAQVVARLVRPRVEAGMPPQQRVGRAS